MTNSGGTPKTNVQRAVLALRERIFSGALPAGSDHLESELATELGMSRTPVREAALVLESQGLVVLRPRRGLRIQPVSPQDMAEIYDILTELESLAARRAAEAEYEEAALAPLAGPIADMDAALASSDLESWAKADAAFHSTLMKLGDNARAQAISEMMEDQVRRARALTLYMRPLPLQSNADHAQVYQAILRGDVEAADTLHRAHRQKAKEMILGLLKKHNLRQV